MQLTSIFAILATAAVAVAMPAEIAPRTGSCNSNQKTVCCNGGLLDLINLNCVLSANTCSGEAYCCNAQGEINILNCVRLL